MSRIAVHIVTMCEECKFCRYKKPFQIGNFICARTNKPIDDIYTIPKWCPLSIEGKNAEELRLMFLLCKILDNTEISKGDKIKIKERIECK